MDEWLDISVDTDIDLPVSVVRDLLLNDATFVSRLRNKELMDTRRLGNRSDRWAQKQPAPQTVQPNTQMRIW